MPTVSAAITKLRQFLSQNKSKDDIYGKAVNGTIPLVVHVENEVRTRLLFLAKADFSQYDIMQLIKIKQETPSLDLVVMGGGGAHLVNAWKTGTFDRIC